jgi:integrase
VRLAHSRRSASSTRSRATSSSRSASSSSSHFKSTGPRHASSGRQRLVRFFGEKERAVAITTQRLAAYLNARTEAGAAASTVRNEMNALKPAFNLARKQGVLLPNELPAFPTIRVLNTRQGFFERAEHEALRAALPPDEGDVCEFMFWTGWRKSEVLALRWKDVDEAAGVIRIETSPGRACPSGSS